MCLSSVSFVFCCLCLLWFLSFVAFVLVFVFVFLPCLSFVAFLPYVCLCCLFVLCLSLLPFCPVFVSVAFLPQSTRQEEQTVAAMVGWLFAFNTNLGHFRIGLSVIALRSCMPLYVGVLCFEVGFCVCGSFIAC